MKIRRLTSSRSWYDIPIQTLCAPGCPARVLDDWAAILRSFYEIDTATLRSQDTPTFSSSNSESRKRFDARTAPVNAPPSLNKHHNITQIRADAVWLSKELDLSEEQALKVVLLEWQVRSQLRLRAGYSDAEIASLKDVYTPQLAFDAEFETSTFRRRDEAEFDTETSRRQRQVFIHFKECIGFARTWLVLKDDIFARKLSMKPQGSVALTKIVDLVISEIGKFTNGPKESTSTKDAKDAEDVEALLYVLQTGRLFYISEILQSLVLAAHEDKAVPPEIIKKWFICMADTQFLRGIEPSCLMSQEELQRFEYLITMVSIALLQPAKTIDHMEASWLLDLDAVSEVQQILLNATDERCIHAIPIAFVWSLVLQDVRERGIGARDRRDSPVMNRALDISSYDSATGRRSSIPGSIQQSVYEDIIDAVLAASGLADPITTIIQHTSEVFRVADLIANMLRTSEGLPFIQRLKSRIVQEIIMVALTTLPDAYGPTVLGPQFAVLQPDNIDADACSIFLQQTQLCEALLDTAAARFPYESYPFLKLCRLLACADGSGKFNELGDHYITFRLKSLKSFTNLAIGDFEKYHTVHEDENANLVELDQHTFAFPREVGLLTRARDQSTTLIIPADTEGEVISDSDPPIIRWNFEYSGLYLVGEWLQLYQNGVLHDALSEYEDPALIASELVLLLTNLLTTTHKSKFSNRDAAISILEEAGINLNFGVNITDVVFNILEQEIQSSRRKLGSTADISVTSAALSFARAILEVQPEHFWRYIAKTSIADESSLLSTTISGVESISGDTSLVTAVCDLYSDMIVASLQRPLSGKSVLYKNDEKVYSRVMAGLTQNMLEVYESIGQWPLNEQDKAKIVSMLSQSFAMILRVTHSMGSRASRLTACLRSAADLIVKHLRPDSAEDARSGPILTYMLGSVQLFETFVSRTPTETCFDSLLRLSDTLIETAKNLKLPTSGLEHCLFDLAPVFVRHLHLSVRTEEPFNSPSSFSASKLLRSLLSSLSSRPTSLLGHLGTDSCINTINIIATSPPNDDFEIEAWTLLAHLISRDQQWLSVVILTGFVPDQKNRTKSDEEEIAYRGRLLVTRALDLLCQIGSQPERLAHAVLQFMIVAQQNWSWTLNALRSRTDVFTSLVRFATTRPENGGSTFRSLVALITDLCSVHLQYAKSIQDKRIANEIAPLVEWLTINVIETNSYNTSLHTNLTRNFAEKFGLALDEFKNHASHSPNVEYYNTAVADLVLGSNPAWNPPALPGRQPQSYASELDRANSNLSTVRFELTLLKSFQSLLLEHASFFAELDTLRGTLAHIAHRCIAANGNTNMKSLVQLQIFDELLQSRAETALALMQQLLRVKTNGSEVRELLRVAWESCLLGNPSYQNAVVDNNLVYWRTSLSLVLLALQFHLGKPRSSSSRMSTTGKAQQSAASELLKHTTNINSQIIEIGRVVVGQGLDTVVNGLLEEKQAEMQRPPSAQPETQHSAGDIGLADLRIIMNFLTSILRHPQLADFQAQLAQIFISTGATQSAMKLYSFSHLLTEEETGHDPIHGEIALRLLVSLSSLNSCAEELAIDGVLSQLLTARVTTALQRIPEGVGNLDTRQHCVSLYTIWSQGILPLVLNLLNAVGGPAAPEVSNFVNAFPKQLARLSSAFRPRHEPGQGFLTLSLAKEVSTMSLISYILDDFRNAGASAAVDPTSIQELKGFDENKASLSSDIREHLALDKNVLQKKVVPATAGEEVLGNKLVDQVIGELKSALVCLTSGEAEP